MAVVGWWASDHALHLGSGHRFRSRWGNAAHINLPTDHRTRHLYGVGSSGSGKSRALRHLICQDVDANRGFTLVDPQDLSREVLAYIAEQALPGRITPEKIAQLGDKLVILEPSDQRFGAPGINLLERQPGQTGYQLVDAIIEIIREIWPDCFGPRLEDICRNSLMLLQEQGLTVLEMLPLLSDAQFRQALVMRTRNPELRLYFEQHLGGLRPAELKTWVESSRNKWSAFLMNPYIRPILGQSRTTISFRQIIDSGQILIVSVSRDKLKESRRLLGALIVALMHQAAIGRENVLPSRRYFHTIFCDEFQEFFCASFLHVLEGSRKYGLALAMFHQNLTQPPFGTDPTIVDTILANAHTRMVFSVSRKDAERLAGELFYPSASETQFQRSFLGIPVERPKFWSLPAEREHYAAELMQQRQGELFVSFKGIGDDEPYAAKVPYVPDVHIDQEKIDILKRHVAGRYYRPLAAIQREIQQRWAAIRQQGAAAQLPAGDFRR